MNRMDKLHRKMDELGFSERHSGTPMVRAAVAMVLVDRDISMTKALYPGLAKATERNGAAVERCIRNAIQTASERTPEAWANWMGAANPTNREVLLRLARECIE